VLELYSLQNSLLFRQSKGYIITTVDTGLWDDWYKEYLIWECIRKGGES